MLDQADRSLFEKITFPCNRLHSILPALVNLIHNTRKCGHSYKLNMVITDLYRRSFLLRCLFAYVWSITITCSCLNGFFFSSVVNFSFIISILVINIFFYLHYVLHISCILSLCKTVCVLLIKVILSYLSLS